MLQKAHPPEDHAGDSTNEEREYSHFNKFS